MVAPTKFIAEARPKVTSYADTPQTRNRRRRRGYDPSSIPRNAFSLVELILVVVIIGVIAAIAIPRVADSAGRSREGALVSSLTAMRNAIDRYAAEHQGAFPGLLPDGASGAAKSPEAFVTQLTKYSDSTGRIADSRDATYRFGPYLRLIPPVPVGPHLGNEEVVIDDTNSPPLVTGSSEGWVYNPVTGEIIANTDAANLAGTRAYDEY